MKLTEDKKVTDHRYMEEIISVWVKPKGWNLSVCTITSKMHSFSFNLVFGEYEEFKKFMKKEYDFDTSHSNARAMYCGFEFEKCRWHFVLITGNEWRSDDYGVICHELHHLVHMGLEDKGVSYGTAGEEIFAHMQGYFMGIVIRALLELDRAKNKQLKRKELWKKKKKR